MCTMVVVLLCLIVLKWLENYNQETLRETTNAVGVKQSSQALNSL